MHRNKVHAAVGAIAEEFALKGGGAHTGNASKTETHNKNNRDTQVQTNTGRTNKATVTTTATATATPKPQLGAQANEQAKHSHKHTSTATPFTRPLTSHVNPSVVTAGEPRRIPVASSWGHKEAASAGLMLDCFLLSGSLKPSSADADLFTLCAGGAHTHTRISTRQRENNQGYLNKY